ncbi:MAG: P1 family peptidase [Calditrichia bacterium]
MVRLTDIQGILVGHAHDLKEETGCTAIVFPQGAVAGADIRGSAPGTREAAMLQPTFMIRRIHAIMLTGGSAFGLRTADGAMRWLAEQKIGFDAQGVCIPIVPAAVLFDMNENRDSALPTEEMGYRACQKASKDYAEGKVGAGSGARVGKILGLANSMPGGLASTSTLLPNGTQVSALAVVNALGDVINPANGQIIAGARHPETNDFIDTYQHIVKTNFGQSASGTNTTLAVVATDAAFSKEEINKIAQIAQAGITRSTRPAHTMHDGDMVFAVSCGKKKADINVVGAIAATLVAEAIVKAVRLTNGL